LLGDSLPLVFSQSGDGLTITPKSRVPPASGISDQKLASAFRVLRITHDKNWINDDDLEVVAHGWLRRCNLGSGDYNNDLTFSDRSGDIWSSSFVGKSVSLVAPMERGAGSLEVQIDGKTHTLVDLSTTGARQAQSIVCRIHGLVAGKHSIAVVNRGPGPVAIDALIAE